MYFYAKDEWETEMHPRSHGFLLQDKQDYYANGYIIVSYKPLGKLSEAINGFQLPTFNSTLSMLNRKSVKVIKVSSGTSVRPGVIHYTLPNRGDHGKSSDSYVNLFL